MKAAVIPQVNGRWELREVPAPEPGPGEVLVRVRACGLCVNDVLATTGAIRFPSVRPAITGHEPAGEIVAVGPGVTARRVGDRVGTTWVRGTCGRCDYCRLGLPVTGQAAFACAAPTTTGFSVQGGHAEYMVVGADETVLLPDELEFELAAPILCAGYTGWSALRTGGRLVLSGIDPASPFTIPPAGRALPFIGQRLQVPGFHPQRSAVPPGGPRPRRRGRGHSCGRDISEGAGRHRGRPRRQG